MSVFPLLSIAAMSSAQCSTSLPECIYGRAGQAFGDVFWSDIPLQGYEADACNADNWRYYETCLANPRLGLDIVYPEELRMRLLLEENNFQPHVLRNTIAFDHPLHGAVMDVAMSGGSPGDAERVACEPISGNYSSKITVARRGGCAFVTKFTHLTSAGAAIGLVINYENYQNPKDQVISMIGTSSPYLNIPAMMVQRAGMESIVSYLDNGGTVRAKVTIDCGTPELPPNNEYGDGCGAAAYKVPEVYNCTTQYVTENRMCEKCPMRVVVGNFSWCLVGNILVPKIARTQVWSSPEYPPLPFTLSNDLIYLDHPAQGYCSPSDFASYANVVVLMEMPVNCLVYESILYAQQAGVAAVILIPNNIVKSHHVVAGPSKLVTIPVHSMTVAGRKEFLAMSKDSPRVVNGTGRNFSSRPQLVEGGYPLPKLLNLTRPMQYEETVESTYPFSTSDEFVGGVVLMSGSMLLTAGWLISRGCKKQHGGSMSGSQRKIPLQVAATGLSFTLILVTTLVSFYLTFDSGMKMGDTMRQNGFDAVNDALQADIEVVADVNEKWRAALLSSAIDTTGNWLSQPQRVVLTLLELLEPFDGSWQHFQTFFPTVRSLHHHTGWYIKITTPSGFFLDCYSKTDSRPNPQRDDDFPHINTTQNGYLYDIVYYTTDPQTNSPIQNVVESKDILRPHEVVGETFGNVFDLVAGLRRSDRSYRWFHSTYSLHKLQTVVRMSSIFDPGPHPISLMLPVFDHSERVIAAVEVHRPMSDLSDAIRTVLAGLGSGAANVTVFALLENGEVLSSSGGAIRAVDVFDTYTHTGRALESLTFHNTYSKELNAFGHHLLSTHPDAELFSGNVNNGVFDQAATYKQPDWLVMRFTFDASTSDTTLNSWHSEVRGGSNGGIGFRNNRQAMYFDRGTVLHIYINLTIDVPRVAKTKVPRADGVWESTFQAYNMTLPGTGIISYPEALTGTVRRVFREPVFSGQFTISVWVCPDNNIGDGTARLFTDTLQRSGAVRLYADGKFKLGAEVFGCETAPIKGGAPIGEWTHILVTVDRAYDEICTVYINGTLHDKSRISLRAEVDSYTEPYRVGAGYVGWMDDFTVFNTSLNGREAFSVYENGELTMDVPVKRWLYNYNSVSALGTPLFRLWIGVLIPEEDVMREMVEHSAKIRVTLDKRDEYNREEMKSKAVAVICIVVAILVASFGVLVVFNSMLIRPVTHIAGEMSQAARMQITHIPQKTSSIRELDTIWKALDVMLINLESYRPYLPKGILPGGLEETVPGLQCGYATLVFTDIQGSTKLWETCGNAMKKALQIHNKVIRSCLEDTGGYEVKTIGDAYMASFSRAVDACSFATITQLRLLHEEWPAELYDVPQCARSAPHWGGLRIRIGVNCGEVEVDFNPVTHRYDYFGNTVNKAARMEGVCIGGGVAVTESVIAEMYDAEGNFYLADTIILSMGQVALKGIGVKTEVSILLPEELADRGELVRGGSGSFSNPLEIETKSNSSSGTRQRAQIARRPIGKLDKISDSILCRIEANWSIDPAVEDSTHETLTSVNNWLGKIITNLERCEGSNLGVLGPAVMAGWNISRSCSTLWDCMLRFIKNIFAARRKHIPMVLGAVRGPTLYGAVGSFDHRYITAIGSSARLTHSLCSRCEVDKLFCLYTALSPTSPYPPPDAATQIGTWEYLEVPLYQLPPLGGWAEFNGETPVLDISLKEKERQSARGSYGLIDNPLPLPPSEEIFAELSAAT